ncbi:ribosomal protection-like ABC-F family protein [Bacillus sp. REN3]|uniref:ribosomal protection-like ABC-F family protein n=1 Tax=Bacillus sp. REN3 TaxID=2802440 RepID=UPI001AEE5744|nr:ABC-F type ribosomal protection protein [Bacillus sp. REN3]
MIICSVDQISKMYGGNLIFQDVSFEISKNDRLGIVGRNGCGKTTLLRLVAGIEEPDNGVLHWKKGLEIGYLAQVPIYMDGMSVKDILSTAFADLLSVQQEMKALEEEMSRAAENSVRLEWMLGKYGALQEQFSLGDGYEMDAKIVRVANGLGIEDMLDSDFNSLSGGEKTKAGLALSLLRTPDLLLLDEPTNHLDIKAAEWLAEFLLAYEGTVVIISHDRYFLDETATKILDMEDGEIELYHTNFSGYVKEKEEKLLREFQAYEEQQKKIKKMKEAIKQLRDWANRSNPPSSALHKRATNMERALARMEKLDRPILDRKKMGLELEAGSRSGKEVLSIKEAGMAIGKKHLFNGLNLHLLYKERAAIVGGNGSGKTTLLKLIMGDLSPDRGEVKIGSGVKIGYLSQHVGFSASKGDTVLDVFRSEVIMNEGEARNILAGFLFYGSAVYKKASQLSGGERMRLRLAQLMHQDLNFLILDEPTNHLDIDSREVLETALEGFSGTLLAVSHDRYFLNKLFNKIYWLENGELSGIEGNYDRARVKMAEKRKEGERPRQDPAIPAGKKPISPPARVPAGSPAPFPEEKLMEKIEAVEREIALLQNQMAEAEQLGELQTLYLEKTNLDKERDELYSMLDEIS